MIDDRMKDKAAQEAEARLAREDLCQLLNTDAGYRYVYRLVSGLGACRMTSTDVDQTMKNIAEQLLDAVAEANPTAYLTMMGQLRGLNSGEQHG